MQRIVYPDVIYRSEPEKFTAIADEIEERTPGFATFNPVAWPSCCGGPMAYLEPVGHTELKGLSRMTIVTNQGTFVVELDPGTAPVTVANFTAYVAANFYSSTIFHRVVTGELIQGGAYLAGPKAKVPNLAPIVLESNNGLKNVRGTIAMARIADQPDSATSEFFINTQDNPAFDRQNDQNPGYAVFGTVVSGIDVVDKINAVATRSVTLDGSGLVLPNVPVTDVRITSITQTQ